MFSTKQTPKWLQTINKGLSIVATITVVFNMSALGVFLAPTAASASTTVYCPSGNPLYMWDRTPSTGWSHGNISGYYEGEYIPVQLALDSLTPGVTTTLKIEHQYVRNSVVGVETLDHVNAPVEPGITYNADRLPFTLSAPTTSGSNPSIKTYTLTFTPTGSTATLYFDALLGSDAHLYNGSSLHVSLTDCGSKDVPISVTQILFHDLQITKTDSSDPITVGNNTTYTIKVKNAGKTDGDGEQNVVVTDTLPAQFTYVPTASPAPTTVSGQVLTWNLGAIADGSTKTITLAAKGTIAGSWTNKAQAISTAVTTAVVATQATVVTGGVCNLVITKTVDKQSAVPGDVLTYTIKYSNTGTGDCTGGGVHITDIVPTNLTYTDSNSNHTQSVDDPSKDVSCPASNIAGVQYGYWGGVPGYESSTRTLNWNANCVSPDMNANGESGTITYKATVNAIPVCTQADISNVAKIKADQTNWITSSPAITHITSTCQGSITVNKKIDVNGNGTFVNDNPSSYGFVWGLDGTNPNRTMGSTASSLTTGQHEVTENTVSDYHFVGWYPTNSTDFSCAKPQGTSLPISVNVTGNQTTAITLCNARNTGTITFHKIVVGGDAAKTDFTFTVNNSQYKDGDSASFLTGTFPVTETGSAGYVLTGASGVCSLIPTTAGAAQLIVTSRGGDCTLTNTRDTGTIIVHKNVLNPDGQEVSDDHAFTVTFQSTDKSVKESQDATYSNVNSTTGNTTYSILEQTDPNYSFDSCTTSSGTCESFTVTKGQTTDVYLVNKQKKATITINKDVRDYKGNDITDTTAFTVNWDNGSGSISENAPMQVSVNPGTYTFAENSNANYSTLLDHYQVTVGSNDSKSITFVNDLKAPAQIVATKIVCDNESSLPNWGLGGPDITATTAADFLAQHQGCHLQPDWQFQWAYDGVSNPGDNIGLSNDPAWHTFGPTDVNGNATVSIQNLQNSDKIWMREGLKPGYVKFAYGATGNDSDVSAEMYCSTDVLNYDNLDYIQSPKLEGTYYCVAFNAIDKGSVKGMKINDLNGNGKIDQNEPGLANWEIKLWNGDSLIATTTTDANGNYSFDNILPGTYSVSETMQNGWTNTTPTPVTNVSVTTSQATTVNFLNFKYAKILGYKYNDINGNGQLDTGDTTISGWWICLNGSHCVQTDNTGKYEFSNLVAGTYHVTETVLPGWTAVFPTALTGYTFTIGSGDVKQGDFFNFKLGSISGKKYEDKTGNGPSNDDVTLSNWTIKLTNGQQTWTDVTDSHGNYSFSNLGPGTYSVSEIQKSGYTQTYGPNGTIALTSGATVTGQNFGNFKLGKISGYKYEDVNGNGKWDHNEPAISGWTITLHIGGQSWTDVTDNHGYFEFTNLTGGNYSLSEENRTGWTQTDSPSGVSVTSGTNSQDNDFGNFQNISIQVCKVVDTNGNGDISHDPFYTAEGGWAMSLSHGDGKLTQNTVRGCTTFTNVGPGNFTVTEGSKEGWTKSYPESNGYSFTAASGDNKTFTFGNYQKGSITATKLLDADGNIKTPKDRSLAPNWKIELWHKNGSKITDGLTAVDGTITFGNLVPGNYTVKEVFDSNYYEALTSTSFDVTVTSGSNGQATFINWALPPYTITATKIVCDNESDLPNWGTGSGNGYPASNPKIGATTAADYIKSHPTCHLQPDWQFQYGDTSAANPGDTFIGLSGAANWHTFPSSTAANGTTTVSINSLQNTIWVREGLKSGYMPFSFGPSGSKNSNNVSAEIYCSNDVLNYDNYDAIYSPEMNHNYYCVAWNTQNKFDVSIIKTGPETASAGDQITYTLQWTVSGNTPVETTIHDSLPANTTFVSASNGGVNNSGTVVWDLGTKNPLATGSVTLTVKLASVLDNETPIKNTGTICGLGDIIGESFLSDGQDHRVQKCNPSETITTTVHSAPVLTIKKDADKATVGGSENITYTIVWSVAGNSQATHVKITDPFILNTSYVSSNCGTTTGACSVTTTATDISYDLGTRQPGEGGNVTLVLKTATSLPNGTILLNTAQIKSDQTDPLFAYAQSMPKTAPKLGITKTVNVTFANPGDVVKYTVVITNTGTDTAHNVTLTDTLPAGLLFADTLTPTKIFTLGDLAVSASVTQSYDVKVGTTTVAGTYNNLAKAQADNNDPVTAIVPLLIKVPTVQGETTGPILELTKTVNVSFATPGDTITYTVIIKNTGDGQSLNVKLSDVLPKGFAFLDKSTTKTWNIGSIDVGISKTITYQVKVGSSVKAGTYENIATLTSDNYGQLQARAQVLIKIPKVLGATVPETGASARDYLIFLVSILFVLAGILFVRKGAQSKA